MNTRPGFFTRTLLHVLAGVAGLQASSCLPALGEPDSLQALLGLSFAASTAVPLPGTVRLQTFAQPMDTTSTPILTAEAFDGAAWTVVPSFGSVLTWTSPTTLSVDISWRQYPEDTNLRYTISGLQDATGTPVADVVDAFYADYTNRVPPVVDGGQLACSYFDGTTWLFDPSCVQTYTVGDLNYPFGQDAHYANTPAARSFTGPTPHATYATDYTTTDNQTGLVWKTCAEGKVGVVCAGTATNFTWYTALNACQPLNTSNAGAGYAGRTDWRLPTMQELKTLTHHGVVPPSIDPAAFPGTASSLHWTATTNKGAAANAWYISFNVGAFMDNAVKTMALPVRCVSGALSQTRSFTDNGNGTVRDNVTGLLWQRCSRGQLNDATCSGSASTASWTSALDYCENLSLGGRSDWRLPSVTELRSLVDERFVSPIVNPAFFPATANAYYHTSTTSMSGASTMTYISFSTGRINANAKAGNYVVRCITN